MSWEDYREIYNNYDKAINQTRLFTLVGARVLKDFPNNLPDDMKTSFNSNMGKLIKSKEFKAETPILIVKKIDPKLHIETFQFVTDDDLFIYAFGMITANYGAEELFKVDFESLLYSQEIVMILAHLDSFIGDSLRIIIQLHPEILKSKKQIDIEDVISCGGWEKLMDHLSEKFVYDLGWKSVSERLDFIKDTINVPIRYSESDLDYLREAKLIRDIVVHNGGKISQEYIDKTKEIDLEIGEFIKIESDYLNELFEISRKIASRIFIESSKKFFGVKASDMTDVFIVD